MTERIAFASLSQTRWANAAGRKADIASGEGWTLAFAWLDGPAAFSDYTGFTRTITLVEGDGFALDFTDHPPLVVQRPGAPASFNGGWSAQCRLLGGPCFVLNAYSLQAGPSQPGWRQSVRVGEPRGIGPLRAGDFAVVLRGQVWVAGLAAGPRDTLRVTGPAAASGSQDALLAVARFDPA
jgi:hypothetical protein